MKLYYACLLYIVTFTSTLLLFPICTNIFYLSAIACIMGASLNLFNVKVNTRRARCIPSSHQAIMEGSFVFLYSAAIPVGFIVTGMLMDVYPSGTMMYIYACLCFIPVIILCFSDNIKEMLQKDVSENYYATKYTKLLDHHGL